MTAPERRPSLLRLFARWVVLVALSTIPVVLIGAVNAHFGGFA